MTLIDEDPVAQGAAPLSEALIKEARRRQRRRQATAALLGLFFVALLSVGIAATLSRGTPSRQPSTGEQSRGVAIPAGRGIATGVAVPCAGLLYVPTTHLVVYQGKHLVADDRLPTGSTFRFLLQPGRYVISNDGPPFRRFVYTGDPFVVRAGQTTHVVVVDQCE